MNTDVLIVGAGLSGLYAAHLLKKQHIQATVVEARERSGGRILAHLPKTDSATGFDMGPSWFWPWQSRMLALMHELKLDSLVYEQHSQGPAIVEYRTGQLAQQEGAASMAGSLRLSGGLQTLIKTLTDNVGTQNIHHNNAVVKVDSDNDGIIATIDQLGVKNTIRAKRIILAAPPRVLANTISFNPSLDSKELELMKSTPTWMAGQAKFVAVYDTPFWREKGLSGDGVSEMGPLGEIHDASAADGSSHALFGFVGLPAQARKNRDQDIIQAATEQLARMFGTGKEQPLSVGYKDWADDTYTATDEDRNGQRSHAHATVSEKGLWDAQLQWAGSETAAVSSGDNGYLEGALAAAERAVSQLSL